MPTKKTKDVVRETWVDLLNLYRSEEEETQTKLDVLQREIRHIKQEVEKLS